MTSAKELLRTAGKTAFAAADLPLRRFPGPRILIYHQIGAGLGRQMEVTVDAFRAQIDWLEANGDIVDIDTALEHAGSPESSRMYVLTFDDGYDDIVRFGFPELKRRRLPFLLYLTTHPTESGEPLTPGGKADPVSWHQIDEMLASDLMTLGAHTHTHPDLRHIDADQVAEELGRSDELIEARTGVTPEHFAYPWGYWSATADAEVRRRYGTATLGSGPPVTASTDPYLINRMPVQLGDGVAFFKRRMHGSLRLEDKLRRRLVRYTGP